jgi:simple sugar transport system substrate-binding protein
MNRIAQLIKEGKPITDGMDLGVPGYKGVKLVNGKVVYGNGAWIDITKENMGDYPF